MDKYSGLAQSQILNAHNAVVDRPANPTLTGDTLHRLEDLAMQAGQIDHTLTQLRERLLGPFPTSGQVGAKVSEVPIGASADIAQKLSNLANLLNSISESATTLERCI